MPSLSDLPSELLLQIYLDLGDIDDVLHPGRCSVQLHNLLENSDNRVGIFKRVIVRTYMKKSNIQLCGKYRVLSNVMVSITACALGSPCLS
jgi:hypothetical protein